MSESKTSRPTDSPQKAHVEFEGVSKSYDGRTVVVRDLDLVVYEGEFLTLLVPPAQARPPA